MNHRRRLSAFILTVILLGAGSSLHAQEWCHDNLLNDGGFALGNTHWGVYGSVDFSGLPGCEDDPGFANMWGNLVVGEGIYQPVAIAKGRTYCFRMCIRYNVQSGRPYPARVRLRALHAPPTGTGQGANIGVSDLTSDADWDAARFDGEEILRWTADADYAYLSFCIENESRTDHGDSTSAAMLDRICVTECGVSGACTTGGHDSLFADFHYEMFIPDPIHLSYTMTNTGTLPLTGCEAAIVLPPDFVLAGSERAQVFTAPEVGDDAGGPAPGGTILPGYSCTRWWELTPTDKLVDADPKEIRWRWRSDQQGELDGCNATVSVGLDPPRHIVFSPLHLLFEAEVGGPLPGAQEVQLWTGGGLSMPWTAQPTESWLDTQPTSGSQSARIAMRPNSTMLGPGSHGANLVFPKGQVGRNVGVTYVLHQRTGVDDRLPPETFIFEVWPQPARDRITLVWGENANVRTVLVHDCMGRIISRHDLQPEFIARSLDLDFRGFRQGVYVVSLVGTSQMFRKRIVVVGSQ